MADTGNDAIDRTKYKYDITKKKTKDGKVVTSYNNGDNIAQAMLGLERKDLVSVLKENELGHWATKNKHLNDGMFRMGVGNQLRTIIRRGGRALVNGKKITKIRD